MSRGPSAKMISEHLGVTMPDAKAIKVSMTGGKIDATMQLANRMMGGHGVEAIQSEYIWVGSYWGNTGLLYVNMGDTYKTTLCYDTEKKYFFIGTWGGWTDTTHWFKRYYRNQGRRG